MPSTDSPGSEQPERVVTAPADVLIAQLADLLAVDEAGLAERVSDLAAQRLMTAAVKLYAAKVEAEAGIMPFEDPDKVTATEVGMTVGRMIRAADLDLFELVSWQSLRGN